MTIVRSLLSGGSHLRALGVAAAKLAAGGVEAGPQVVATALEAARVTLGVRAAEPSTSSSSSSPLSGSSPSSSSSASRPFAGSSAASPQETAGRVLRESSQALVWLSTRSAVDAFNDISAALGIQLRIIQADSPEGQVHVRVIDESNSGALATPGSPTLTPRQFIKLMREANECGSMQGLGRYVDRLISDGSLKPIAYVPAKFERILYLDVARLIVFGFHFSLRQLDKAQLWGHTFTVKTTPVFKEKIRRKTEHGSDAVATGVSERQLRLVVDEMLGNQALHMSFVPKVIQKRLYVNCLVIVFQLLEDLISGEGEEIVCLGHRFSFKLEPLSIDVFSRLVYEAPVKPCTINQEVLAELVDELLQDDETNIVWLPDAIEREIYHAALSLLVRSAEYAISRLELTLLGREVKMGFLSSLEAAQAQKRNGAGKEEATFYMEEDEPFSTVSYTELEERLKDLTERRRVVRAIAGLGGASFDLTADTPMLPAAQHLTQEQAGPKPATSSASSLDSTTAPTTNTPNVAVEAAVHSFQTLAHTLKLARTLNLTTDIEAEISVPYSMIADVETYNLWMPWCTSGTELTRDREAHLSREETQFDCEVGFGFETRTFLGTIGDRVKYRLTIRPPPPVVESEGDVVIASVLADTIDGFAYGERLAYDWRFTSISPTRTKVELDMFFQARSVIYMPLWDSMQHMVVTKMLVAFKARAEKLQREAVSRSRVGDDTRDEVPVAP